jgi:hypothetical protein
MSKVIYFSLIFIFKTYLLLCQTNEKVVINAKCVVNDYISFNYFDDVTDLQSMEKSPFISYQGEESVRKIISIKKATRLDFHKANRPTLYIFPNDTLYIKSQGVDKDEIFEGKRADEWNFSKKLSRLGYPITGEDWNFPSCNQDNFLDCALLKKKYVIELIEKAKDTLNLSPEYLRLLYRDIEYVFIKSLAITYNYPISDKLPQRKMIDFMKQAQNYIQEDSLGRSNFLHYYVIQYWNAFITKYVYKLGISREAEFEGAKRLDKKMRDTLIYWLLEGNITFANWELQGKQKAYLDYFINESKNEELKMAIKTKIGIDTTGLYILSNNQDLLNAKLESTDSTFIIWKDLIEKHKGKIIYIDFWASWCKPCRQHIIDSHKKREMFMPTMEKIVIINVTLDDNRKLWKRAIKELSMDDNYYYHYLIDEKNSLTKFFLPNLTVPQYVIIGKDGQLITKNALNPANADLWIMLKKYINQ